MKRDSYCVLRDSCCVKLTLRVTGYVPKGTRKCGARITNHESRITQYESRSIQKETSSQWLSCSKF